MSDSPASILHNTSGTEIATASNPVRVDPTGTTAQPVTQSTASNLKTQVDGQGTAGSPAGGVVSVQGVASGTVLPVSDGGGTLTVDGTVTANIGTGGNLALDATLTGGTQKAIVRGGAKGAISAADVTSTAEGTDHQALDVQVMHGGAAVNPTAIRALTSSDVVTATQGTAAATAGAWPAKVTDGTNVSAVKAASTPAAATDPALVVAISPNNTPVLPSGAATSAAQTTGNSSLGSIDTKTPALGQAAMAASQPVVIASNQTAVPVTGSFSSSVVPNGTPVTGTITALNGTVQAAAEGWESINVVITGTWNAQLVFEVSSDSGSTWLQAAFIGTAAPNPNPVLLYALTANGTYQGVGNSACTHVRVRAAAFTSGTVSVRIVLASNRQAVPLTRSLMQQNVVASSNNNSTANLAAGASFTGTAENTLGVVGILVNLKADQSILVKLQQSPDSTNWDHETEFTVMAGVGDNRTYQATASYFRIILTNVGNATTTYLRLQVTLCPVAEALPPSLTPNRKLSLAAMTTSWAPDPSSHQDNPQNRALRMDVDRNLNTRSRVLTDEASFRDDFTGTAIYSDKTGTYYFTNGSKVVTGVGTAFLTELNKQHHIKQSTHADSAYALVDDVKNDTYLELIEPYTGATASGTGRASFWKYTIGSGASITQTGSEILLASGTTSGSRVHAHRGGDYLPYVIGFKARVTQRIANQIITMGLGDSEYDTAENQAMLVFDGTTNTTVKLRTSSSAADVEITTATLPDGLVSSTSAYYQLEVTGSKVTLFCNDVKLIEHKLHIPGPYAPMDCHADMHNTGVAGSTTTLALDTYFFNNFDRVEIAGSSKGDPFSTKEMRASVSTVTSVAAAVADTLLLAANPNRLGATVVNDGTSILYLKFGSGASATSYTVRMTSYAYYEVPFGYTGRINGYWAAANGNARVTEVQ